MKHGPPVNTLKRVSAEFLLMKPRTEMVRATRRTETPSTTKPGPTIHEETAA